VVCLVPCNDRWRALFVILFIYQPPHNPKGKGISGAGWLKQSLEGHLRHVVSPYRATGHGVDTLVVTKAGGLPPYEEALGSYATRLGLVAATALPAGGMVGCGKGCPREFVQCDGVITALAALLEFEIATGVVHEFVILSRPDILLKNHVRDFPHTNKRGFNFPFREQPPWGGGKAGTRPHSDPLMEAWINPPGAKGPDKNMLVGDAVMSLDGALVPCALSSFLMSCRTANKATRYSGGLHWGYRDMLHNGFPPDALGFMFDAFFQSNPGTDFKRGRKAKRKVEVVAGDRGLYYNPVFEFQRLLQGRHFDGGVCRTIGDFLHPRDGTYCCPHKAACCPERVRGCADPRAFTEPRPSERPWKGDPSSVEFGA